MHDQPESQPTLNPGRVLRLSAMRYSHHVALEFEGKPTTYLQLNEQVNAMAHFLGEQGVAARDRVVIVAPNGPDYVRLMFAAAKLGAVAVPTNTGLLAHELAHVLRASSPRLVAVGDEYFDRVSEAVQLSGLSSSLVVLRLLPDSDGLAVDTGCLGISGFGDGEPTLPSVDDSDIAILLFTSGSSGTPKAVAKSYANVTWHALNRQISQPRHEGDRELFVLPLSGVGFGNFLLTDILVGATCVLEPRFDADRTARLLQTGSIRVAFLAPTMLLAVNAAYPGASFSTLEILETAYEVTDAQRRTIAEMFPRAQIMYSYGCTEGSMARAEPDAFLGDPSNVGYASGLDEYRVVPHSEDFAEIEVSGPTVMRGYLRSDGSLESGAIKDGWLGTGDLGRQDELGAVHFVGRSKDMIKTGGLNVFAAEVEAALLEHPSVARVAVMGVPDDYWGEAVVAVLELTVGASNEGLEGNLREHAKRLLAGYKCPKRYLKVDALPINAGGKLAKGEVRRMVETGLATALAT